MASRILVKNIAIEKGGIVDKRKIIKLIQHLSDLFYSKILLFIIIKLLFKAFNINANY